MGILSTSGNMSRLGKNAPFNGKLETTAVGAVYRYVSERTSHPPTGAR